MSQRQMLMLSSSQFDDDDDDGDDLIEIVANLNVDDLSRILIYNCLRIMVVRF